MVKSRRVSVQKRRSIRKVLVWEGKGPERRLRRYHKVYSQTPVSKTGSCSRSQKAFSSHSLPACFQPPQARQGCLPSCPLLYSPTALVTAAVGLQELRFQRRCPVSKGTAPSCTTEHHRVESVCAPGVGQGEGRLPWLGCVAACRHLVCSPETGAGGRGSYSRRERMLYSYI